MILIYIFALVVSFYLLAIITEDYFVESLERIADKLKLSPEMAGATFMAIGSSAPEFFTALLAIFRTDESANLGASTIVGSAIFNILVIIGVSSLFATAKLTWQPVIRDLAFYSLSIVILLITFIDGKVTVIEAVIYLFTYLFYIFIVSKWQKWFKYKTPDIPEEAFEASDKNLLNRYTNKVLRFIIPNPSKKNMYIGTFIVSILLIGLLSHLLVDSAAHLGKELGIPATLMGLTILAAGTSIPDLLSSIIVSKRGKGDMAISNAVGSNIFDILFALGAPWLIFFAVNGESHIEVDNDNLFASIFLLFATVLSVLTLLVVRKWKIGPKAGLLLLGVYVGYVIYNIVLIFG